MNRFWSAKAGLVGLLVSLSCAASPFSEDWSERWKPVYALRDTTVRRAAGGALDVDATSGGHIYFVGGETMRDMRVTAKVKFLRADDKYSGFSLFLRWNGDVWTDRDGFWIYLRPKFRSLHMQKVLDGKLVRGFSEQVEAKRPQAVPLNEWLTLRYEAEGRQIRVFLNDELHLTATDEGLLPITAGRMAFGAGDAHVVVAELSQENLERSDPISISSYRYLQAPTRGDPERTILTDGKVNAREEQAFWRMLGPRPEIVFDLGEEVFVTRARLQAISSPALNLSTAEILGSDDGEDWKTLAMLTNNDSRRADAEHEVTGEVRGVARYLKLILNRPAADQDVELAEVTFYGRPPTDADRAATVQAPYDTGPVLRGLTDPAGEDPKCLYLASPRMRVAIHRGTGVVAGLWNLERGVQCLERQHDRYHLATREDDVDTDEYRDEVIEILSGPEDGTIHLRCRNPSLPDVVIDKRYSLSPDGARLIKRTGFLNTSDAPDWFLTHATGAIASEDFRRHGVYMGCDRGLGARLFADAVTVPRQIGALGARNSKVVLLHRYDLGWGVGQFRHKINDRWCRPLTARYYEKENHPPLYLPNGWRFGVCTLHLRPGEEQSTELQTALYNGRQIDFYRMWRFLPETQAAWDRVSRPVWQRDLKTSARVSPPQMSGDQQINLLPVQRALALCDSGNLWYLGHIHGVWGNWYSSGTVQTGEGAQIETDWLKTLFEQIHAVSPRIKHGVYTWAWAVHPQSDVFQNHPDWFIARDRQGQLFNAYSNMVLNHLRLMSVPESMDELIDQYAAIMRTFDGDFFYLDGGGGGANLIDWEHLTIDYDTHWEELYARIREITRACGEDKGVWYNARTGPHWDVGYYEGIDRSLHAATWRDSADGLSVVKIRQVFDPDQVIVPLYWRTPTMPFFSNYCIGLGITPSSPLGGDDQLRKLPYIEAAYETRRMRWLEADLRPDWRVDPDTEIEAYALAHGEAAVLSVIDHRTSSPGSAEVSADTRALGLTPGEPVYAFVFANRDIRESGPALPEALRRDVYQRTRWGLDMVARVLDVRVIESPGDRIALTIPTEPDLLRMVVLTQDPAAVFSVAGLRVNVWAPGVLGASVSSLTEGDTMRVTAEAPEGGAEIVVCAPPGKALAGDNLRSVTIGDVSLAVVPVKAGESTVALRLVDRPSDEGRELTLTCPGTVAAGTALEVGITPAPPRVRLQVTRNDVLVAVTDAAVRDGAFTLPIPAEAGAGEWSVEVRGLIDGQMHRGAASFTTEGEYAPDLPPVHAPKTYPQPIVREVDVTHRGVHVVGVGQQSSDGYSGQHVTWADPGALRFGGSMADAPQTRYGYAFGGLEIEGARVLSLKTSNTIHGAWTFHRGVESFKPQYTTTFAGVFVDYQTPDGYTHRVALGMGIMNPKRTTPRPQWGAARKPDAFISLGDLVHEEPENSFTIDLAQWAPNTWTGRCWLIGGVSNLFPGRGLAIEITDATTSPEGKEILRGKDLGGLYTRKTYRVAKVSDAPVIDGDLNEDVWRQRAPATDFHLLGRAAVGSQKTEAWLAYDERNLYIAFDCTETERAVTVSSEKLWGRDAVDIALNPSGDRATFLQIIADAEGEFEQFSHHPESKAFNWKGVRVATGRREGGWTVEMAVPLTEMGLKPVAGVTWAGNFVRYRANDPMLTWAFMPGPAINDPERFGVFVLE